MFCSLIRDLLQSKDDTIWTHKYSIAFFVLNFEKVTWLELRTEYDSVLLREVLLFAESGFH